MLAYFVTKYVAFLKLSYDFYLKQRATTLSQCHHVSPIITCVNFVVVLCYIAHSFPR